MKRIKLLFIALISASSVLAQVPNGINYQATVRDASGNLMVNQNIDVEFEIRYPNNVIVAYQENQNLMTNNYGGFSAIIGHGNASQGNFANLNWNTGSDYFLNVKVNGTDLGTTQLVSVPFAFQANAADYANHALLADSSLNSGHALISDTADYTNHALSADNSLNSVHALISDTADYAYHALLADSSLNSGHALISDTAEYAKNTYWQYNTWSVYNNSDKVVIGGDFPWAEKLTVESPTLNTNPLINMHVSYLTSGNILSLTSGSSSSGFNYISCNGDLEVKKGGTINTKGEINRESTGNANMVPIAYGYINSWGTISTSNSTGNFTVNQTGTGIYQIDVAGVTDHYDVIVIATSVANSGPELITFTQSQDYVTIRSRDLSGLYKDTDFNFVMYKL